MKLSDLLLSVDSPEGRERVARYLEALPFPHYQPHPSEPELRVRIERDGTHTVGRFRRREFVVLGPEGQ